MKWIFKGICFAAVVALAALGFGYVTMQLWNWLMPAVFGLKMISFWQAFGILILAKILFGGFHRGTGGKCCGHGGWKNHGGHWKNRWESKMANMTPEEKEKFISGMSKCGWGGHSKKETSDEQKIKD
ncbi:MAG: hypothetical protein NT084_03385 [Bacteroidetes bacterium]|jgi:hypothetical protein|nr:hypothetical protein [Bacteroidota bacterium]